MPPPRRKHTHAHGNISLSARPPPDCQLCQGKAPPFAARPHRSFYCKTSGQGGPPSCTSSEGKHKEKPPPRKVTARILALIVRQSQLGHLGQNASPLRSYHAQHPNNMAKSLVGEDSAPPQATTPLAYVTADRGARSPAPPPLSSYCSSSPPPLLQPLPAKYRESFGESNQGFDS